jgi:hypothetical protein
MYSLRECIINRIHPTISTSFNKKAEARKTKFTSHVKSKNKVLEVKHQQHNSDFDFINNLSNLLSCFELSINILPPFLLHLLCMMKNTLSGRLMTELKLFWLLLDCWLLTAMENIECANEIYGHFEILSLVLKFPGVTLGVSVGQWWPTFFEPRHTLRVSHNQNCAENAFWRLTSVPRHTGWASLV